MSFMCQGLFVTLLLHVHTIAAAEARAVPLRVHPWPGGGTLASPFYAVSVDGLGSFVWYTSVANRQPIAPGNNVPVTPVNKDTSFTMFDMSSAQSPSNVSVMLLQWKAKSVEVRPSSAGITAMVTPNGKGIEFTMTEPRQVCVVVNGNADNPLCIFADPAQETIPTSSSDTVIYFGPGVHYPGPINVKDNQTVYLAGGAHVYGQVVAAANMPCTGVKVVGRGVLDGHNLAIDYRAKAMIHTPTCEDSLVEGITTVDSPMYQIFSYAPRVTIRFAKAIAWGYTTDGWGAGEYSTIEHCFFKVNDDSSKLYFTGMLVQHNVYWQMENGCALMMSWNTEGNVGFVTARNNDIIAHEKLRHDSDLDGVVCAYHGGQGNLNNYLIDGLRIESAQWSFVSINLLSNPWSPQGAQIGNISTIILRNVTAALSFSAPPDDSYHLWGNSSKSRLDTFVYDNVKVAGRNVSHEDIAPGIGPFATNITTCIGCAARMLPSLGEGQTEWSWAQKCGNTPQPLCDGVPLPPLNGLVGQSPFCKAPTAMGSTSPGFYWNSADQSVTRQVLQRRAIIYDPKLKVLLRSLHSRFNSSQTMATPRTGVQQVSMVV